MPESLGMLESGHGHDDDRGRSLHACMRLLRRDNGQALCAGRRRAATRRRSRAPDEDWCIQTVLDAGPDIYNHNMETVERLTPLVRSRAKYRTSLQVLRRAKELSSGGCRVVTKSGVMLGLGEKETELFQAMDDLREVGCEVLTMGQYLRPTPKHLPVVEYITPDQFDYYGDIARKKGFLHVASGPLVRSSYHAADFHPVVRR